MGDCAENCHKCSTKGTAKCDVDGCITGYHHNADNDICVGECILYDLETGVVVRLDLCLPPPPYLSSCLQGFKQNQIIASHTCFGGHMDVNY